MVGRHSSPDVSADAGVFHSHVRLVCLGVGLELQFGRDGTCQVCAAVFVDAHLDDGRPAAGERLADQFEAEVDIEATELALRADHVLAACLAVLGDVVDQHGRDADLEQRAHPGAGELLDVLALVVVQAAGVVRAGGGVDHDERDLRLDDLGDVSVARVRREIRSTGLGRGSPRA